MFRGWVSIFVSGRPAWDRYYKKNGPADQFKRAGLETVAKNPRKPYTGNVTKGDRRYFKAIFADRGPGPMMPPLGSAEAGPPTSSPVIYVRLAGELHMRLLSFFIKASHHCA